MNTIKNPVREHWASIRLPAFLAGTLPKSHYTLIRAGGKIVGKVQNGVFIKRVIGSIHILHKLDSIGFDIDSLKQAKKAGASTVKITDKETGIVYRVAISTIWNRGFHLPDYGYGEQIALKRRFWSKGNEPVFEQLGLELWR